MSEHKLKKHLNNGRQGFPTREKKAEPGESEHRLKNHLNNGKQGFPTREKKTEPGESEHRLKKHLNNGRQGLPTREENRARRELAQAQETPEQWEARLANQREQTDPGESKHRLKKHLNNGRQGLQEKNNAEPG